MAIMNCQKTAIHKLIVNLKWSRLMYLKWLRGRFGVESCVQLSGREANEAIAELEEFLREETVSKMITQKQVNYIKFLWLSVDYAECEQGSRLLSNFLRNKYGVEKPEQLSKQQAFGCISAIKQMQKNAEARKGTITVANHTSINPTTGDPVAWITLADGRHIAVPLTDKMIQ